MRDKRTGAAAAQDPNSPINRALAAWDCDVPEGLKPEHVSEGIRAVKITKAKVGSEARKRARNPAPSYAVQWKSAASGRWQSSAYGTKAEAVKDARSLAAEGARSVSVSVFRDGRAEDVEWRKAESNPAKPRGVKYTNEAKADKKDDPSWIGYAVQKATGGGAYAIFEKKTEAVDYARELANKMGRQMAVVRYRYKVQQ